MRYIEHTIPKMLIADEGKVLKIVNDVYAEAYVDEEGNQIEEHTPYRTTIVFLPDSITEEQAVEMYVEEET